MRIAVVGDIILDQYIYGTKHKINPENPNGSVILQQKIEYKLGGAAAVASICKNLGSNVDLIGSVGNDAYGYIIKQKISGHIITIDKITTVKTRLVIDGKLYKHRLDNEDTSEKLVNLPAIPNDLIMVQDYGKGFITKELMSFLQKQDRPIIVDPCFGRDWNIYGSVDLIKCNKKEAYTNIGYDGPSDRLCKKLCDKYGCSIVLTDGKNGVFWSDESGNGHIPAKKCSVKDVCGAGDTVFAVIGQYFFDKKLSTICQIAARVAEQQISKIGIYEFNDN